MTTSLGQGFEKHAISGSLNYGQGHAVTFAQILSDRLGIPMQRLALLQGDSDELIAGAGTGGSRSVICTGSALLGAADKVEASGRRLAGRVLEAAPEDIELVAGEFRVAGTDRGVGILELAARARELGGLDGALPAVMNAVVDVLAREKGIVHLDMPATPPRVWAALNGLAA